MADEKIKVRSTENDQIIEVLVYSKTEKQIEVMVGEGIHSTKCKLLPTSNNMAYAGEIMGREIVYERTLYQVREDIEALQPSTRRR